MKLPLVSVVLCTYNGNRFIAEQVESICRQTHTELEIIIVDDASTDATYSTLQQMAAHDHRIRLYANAHNLGFNLNFNRACSLASGDYIAIADQDDIWHEQKIAILLAKLQEDPQNLLVHCISARFEKFGEFHLKSPKLVNYHAGDDVKTFFLSNFISGHNMLLKKELLQMSMPFPAAVYYDWWLAAVASCNGHIRAVPEILVWHRMHDANATGAAKPKIFLHEQVKAILPHLLQIPGMKQADQEFAQQLLKYYQQMPAKKFLLPLFLFLVKNAGALFAYKKRSFPWFSYIKHAWKASRAATYA